MADKVTVDLSSLGSYVDSVSSVSLEQVIAALLVLIVGYLVIKVLMKQFGRIGEKNLNIPSLTMLQLTRALKVLLYFVLIMAVLGILGFDIDGILISITAGISIILGFGLQDTINNLASGIWISASRAYDLEDEVTIAGETGTVKNVSIMATELKKLDNTRVIIPNGKVWNSAIINVTKMDKRLIVLDYGVSYDTNINDAIKVALDVADSHPKLHKEPAPIVRFKEMADSSIVLQLRVWVDTDDYYPVKSDVLKMLFEKLTETGINIPFPQVDVHMKEQ
ncbi:small-conductance mechanosensitive channel [Methanomicrobium sp. W14]|uniref:mechanosensitive ion channel family protein n=1 Tax=Methanomicrobium sp. W14 TaxID=2817839 RepID=UPI001AE9DD79|nr:mechanosensitive ion channel family protein [Methanomicrobium sp. W14]MBP2133769.1 small-conductance mechanosensitive channel [Methanomicrobium sp. W14]